MQLHDCGPERPVGGPHVQRRGRRLGAAGADAGAGFAERVGALGEPGIRVVDRRGAGDPHQSARYRSSSRRRADVARSGDLLTLEIQLTNLEDGSLTSGSSFTASVRDNNVTGITLVDGRNKKRYLPAKDSAGTCLCSKAYVSLDKGGSTILSATYAGPPADVDTLSVELPGFGMFADLPVSG